jgi:uncharacterized protein (UPF0332 family)
MSFDWIEYFEIAKQLANQAHQPNVKFKEGKYRAAISRAYYSAFIKARNRLRDVDNVTSPRKDGKYGHTFVILTYENNPDVARHNIGLKLRVLRNNRERADYEDSFPDAKDVAKQTLRLANEIIHLLDTL